MAKEEDLKRVDLKVTVNCCDGCRKKVLKAVSIKGVLKTEIHPTLPKITVSGNVEAKTLIKKLSKIGKSAELWPIESRAENFEKNMKFENISKNTGNKRNEKVNAGKNNEGNISTSYHSGHNEEHGTKGNKSMNDSSDFQTVFTTMPQVNKPANSDMIQPHIQGYDPMQCYPIVPVQNCIHGHCHCHCQLPVYSQPQQASGFTDYFDDDNTVGCTVM